MEVMCHYQLSFQLSLKLERSHVFIGNLMRIRLFSLVSFLFHLPVTALKQSAWKCDIKITGIFSFSLPVLIDLPSDIYDYAWEKP